MYIFQGVHRCACSSAKFKIGTDNDDENLENLGSVTGKMHLVVTEEVHTL